MHVSQLWRYPIKSLGAEPLETAQLSADGIAGDRIVHVHNASGPVTVTIPPFVGGHLV